MPANEALRRSRYQASSLSLIPYFRLLRVLRLFRLLQEITRFDGDGALLLPRLRT